MPGKTSVGSALAETGDTPAASTAADANAANARIVRRRIMDSDPSGPAQAPAAAWGYWREPPLLILSRRQAPALPHRYRRDGAVGLAGPTRRPARGSEDVAHPVAQARCRSPIAGDRHVLAGLQLPDVEGVDLLGQAVVRSEQLGLKAAEQAVPEDEDAAVVLVRVELVHPMVHPVVRRRVEDELEGPRQFVDSLGVHPELVDQVQRPAEVHHPRGKAQQR